MALTRQQWKDILEAIGFIAIISSLYFVGIETRHSAKQTELNTQAIEISAYQELISNITAQNMLSMQSEEVAAVMLQMRDLGPELLDETRLSSAFYSQFRHGDIAFFMYERGVINEDRLQSTLRPLPLYGETGQQFWEDRKGVFVEPYQQYIDKLIAEGFWE